MGDNRGLVYLGPGKVEVQNIADPKFEDPHGRKIEHAVILKVVSTNICGSDQHMVRGRTTAQPGLVLGHEITGEVIEMGSDVELLRKGDIVAGANGLVVANPDGGKRAEANFTPLPDKVRARFKNMPVVARE